MWVCLCFQELQDEEIQLYDDGRHVAHFIPFHKKLSLLDTSTSHTATDRMNDCIISPPSVIRAEWSLRTLRD